jgi:IS5 family transposase
MGFFDLSDCYASLDAKKDPLLEIDGVVPWEEFRPALERIWRKPDADRKSRAGRKPIDAVLMFKALVLSALYNLSDDQIEYQVRDRLSFMRFLGLGLGDRVPDAKTVWFYRDALAQAGKVDELFGLFDGNLNRQGYIARGGQILDASIVPVPRNHNTRDENAAIKEGKVPKSWTDKPAKRVQKDVDARWTKKHGKSHYGYKNHVNVDQKHKLVRRYHVSDAALHDSQAVDHLLMKGNTGSGVWADAAYRSEEMEAKLRARKLKSHIHRKGKRPSRAFLMYCRAVGKPLSDQAKGSNRTKSTVRVRVEHIFGAQANDMGGTLVRTIGLARAEAKIGIKNLAYNMRRLCQLRHINPNPA